MLNIVPLCYFPPFSPNKAVEGFIARILGAQKP